MTTKDEMRAAIMEAVEQATEAAHKVLGQKLRPIMLKAFKGTVKEMLGETDLLLTELSGNGEPVIVDPPMAEGSVPPVEAQVEWQTIVVKDRTKKKNGRNHSGRLQSHNGDEGPVSKSGSRLPPEGTITRRILDFVNEHGPSHRSTIIQGVKTYNKAQAESVHSLISQLVRRQFIRRQPDGKYAAFRVAGYNA